MKIEFLQLLMDFAESHADLDQKQHQHVEFPCLKHQLASSAAFDKSFEILSAIFAELNEDSSLIEDLRKLKESVTAILEQASHQNEDDDDD